MNRARIAAATTLSVLIATAASADDWTIRHNPEAIAERLDAEEARSNDLEASNEELQQRSDELEERNDDLEAQLERMQHQLNLRDPAWRAQMLQRCQELGQIEARPLCARLYREQSWSEWFAASWRNGVAKQQPKTPPPARSIPRAAPSEPAAVVVAAPPAAPSRAAAREAEQSVTITKPDGSRVRLVYDPSGALRRSEEVK